MATYYAQRHPRDSSLKATGSSSSDDNDDLTSPNDIPADHSVYIFPNPSSTGTPSSWRSSILSVPTDVGSSDSFWSDSRLHTSHYGTRSSTPELNDVEVTRRRISQLTDDEVEIDVESWDLSPNPSRFADSDDSWVLENEVERLGAGGIDFTFVDRQSHRRTRGLSPNDTQHYWSVRPYPRPRTQSRHRTINSLSSSSFASSARAPAPHPRITIPLLSFFSSLLFIDVEDDLTIRLLTHTDPDNEEAVLFPGRTTAQLCHTDEALESGSDSDSERPSSDDGAPHGLPKLLLASFSDELIVAVRSLRAGLAAWASHSRSPATMSDLAHPIAGASALLGLWRVVGTVCARGSQACKEVWGGDGGASAFDAR